MIPCISVENMRLSDAYTIEHLVPSLELMRRAARGVYLAHRWTAPVAIVAGSGNNGGNGFAVVVLIHIEGFEFLRPVVDEDRGIEVLFGEILFVLTGKVFVVFRLKFKVFGSIGLF